jgi:hypothetical protein
MRNAGQAAGESHHSVTEYLQPRVPGAVLFESGSGSVGAPAVDLDHETLVAPPEVDLEAIELRVHLGQGKAVAAAEGEHPLRSVRVRSVSKGSPVGP